ncbi:hypothetical protein [Endozoicomonas sp. SESOKO1]|nr:hypothetical protein [Endozoicomonas sp. SESOKO1]
MVRQNIFHGKCFMVVCYLPLPPLLPLNEYMMVKRYLTEARQR